MPLLLLEFAEHITGHMQEYKLYVHIPTKTPINLFGWGNRMAGI